MRRIIVSVFLGLLCAGAAAGLCGAGGSGADRPDSFLAIHFEPRSADARGFEALQRLVRLADAHRTRLTLQFTPSWARLILADPARLRALRGWQARGHEVAAHHHGARHGWEWDGYTNLPEETWRAARERAYQLASPQARQIQATVARQGLGERYFGDMAQAMALMRRLAGAQPVRTMTMGPDRISDWPADVPYSLDNIELQPNGSYDITGGAVTRPTAKVYSGRPVLELSMRFVSSIEDEALAEFEHAQARAGDFVGFVTHIEDFAGDPRPVQLWLGFQRRMDPSGARSRTVSSLLGWQGQAKRARRR